MLNNSDEISFSFNWNNKLDCKAFTTLRLENKKYQANLLYKIKLKGEEKGTAKCIAVKTFFLKDINEFISYIDTGYSKEECYNIIYKMYPNVDFNETRLSLILLNYIKI